jgi:hypothetical protein
VDTFPVGGPEVSATKLSRVGWALDYARAYYEHQRQRGKGHHAVVRALAFKWIRIAFRCWKNSVAYDESRYLATLVRRASLLSASMVASTLATTL